MSRDCCVALSGVAMGLSAVCDCGPDHTYYFLNLIKLLCRELSDLGPHNLQVSFLKYNIRR